MRHRIGLAAALVGACALMGCQAKDGSMAAASPASSASQVEAALQAVKAVPMDNTTPDRALKTLWAQGDAHRRASCAAWNELRTSRDPKIQALNAALAGPQVDPALLSGSVATIIGRAAPCASDTYDREINNIKQETDSRAVALVTVRNVSPIPPGAKEQSYMKEGREKGDVYRYVFTKAGASWRVEEVYETSPLIGSEYRHYDDAGPSYPYSTTDF